MNESLIELRDIKKIYHIGGEDFAALAGITLTIREGEFAALMGPSGSGKSTLMNILGCLDRPTTGSYKLDGKEVAHLSDDELAVVRNKHIGFVFQNFNLLVPHFRPGQRSSAARLRRCIPQGTNAPGLGKARCRWSQDLGRPQAQRAFRRPASACCHCQSARQQSPYHHG